MKTASVVRMSRAFASSWAMCAAALFAASFPSVAWNWAL